MLYLRLQAMMQDPACARAVHTRSELQAARRAEQQPTAHLVARHVEHGAQVVKERQDVVAAGYKVLQHQAADGGRINAVLNALAAARGRHAWWPAPRADAHVRRTHLCADRGRVGARAPQRGGQRAQRGVCALHALLQLPCCHACCCGLVVAVRRPLPHGAVGGFVSVGRPWRVQVAGRFVYTQLVRKAWT
jgi:hypothetical protein